MAQEQKELDMVDRDPNGINSHVKVTKDGHRATMEGE